MVTFVAGQAVETILERLFARKIAQVIGDATPSADDQRNLLEREEQLDLFQWREGHITASVAQRFKRGLDGGYDPFEVFRAVQNHAANAARGHIDTVILEAFTGAIERCEDDSLKQGLGLLCDLYALHNIEQDRGFLLWRPLSSRRT
jgi:acyl-CoA oxidase